MVAGRIPLWEYPVGSSCEMLYKGASVLTISMGLEYPGLDDSVLLEGNGVPLDD
jgi:hypothetical protein